ncbi:MAG: hypothetical protein ACR2KY_04430 [Thermoleophilaceae bacterium]
MRLTPPRLGEILAGAAGAVLLVSLFLPWFRATAVAACPPGSGCPGGGNVDEIAFEAFAVLDLLLAALALAGIGLVIAQVAAHAPAIPVAWASLTVLLGIVTTIWVLVSVISPPGQTFEPLFALIGLAASAGVTIGALLSMRDEGFGVRPKPGIEATLSRTADRGPEPLPVPDGLRPGRQERS